MKLKTTLSAISSMDIISGWKSIQFVGKVLIVHKNMVLMYGESVIYTYFRIIPSKNSYIIWQENE